MSEQSMASWSLDLLAAAQLRLEALAVDLVNAPEEARRTAEATHAALMSGTGVRGATYVVILLFIGVAVEWLYWSYAYSPLRALQATPAHTPAQALRLGLRHLVLRGSGVLLFTMAAIGASAAFDWPPHVHELVIVATLFLLVLRLSWIAISIVISPRRARLRLVPVEPARARWLATALIAAIVLLAIGRLVPAIVDDGAVPAHHLAGALRLAGYSAAALLLFVTCFAFFGQSRRQVRSANARAPLFPRSFPLALLVVAVYGIWLMNAGAAAAAAIAAIVIALLLGLRDMVHFYWRSEVDPKGERGALPAIALSLARFLVVLLGAGAAALALDTPLAALAESASPWVRIGLRLLGVTVLALLAHGVWIAVRSVVDQRLSHIGPADPHHPPDASSRLLTLLPLLRVTTAISLLVLLVLTSLWALGIEITPLLAGAGVVGLALGFGAQALVRDVIAGVFFLAEDAFRVGEYIEGSGNSKGTVERISLRSVALRHHNGPLHIVPYGSLGTVRNNSRDWIITKFNIPLPIGTESEKIRKMFKKVGEEMLTDPVIGPMVGEPLKGKLYRVDPGVKIFRCKFRTAPGKQFDVRANALKRIEEALDAMGVSFAKGQTVLMQSEPG